MRPLHGHAASFGSCRSANTRRQVLPGIRKFRRPQSTGSGVRRNGDQRNYQLETFVDSLTACPNIQISRRNSLDTGLFRELRRKFGYFPLHCANPPPLQKLTNFNSRALEHVRSYGSGTNNRHRRATKRREEWNSGDKGLPTKSVHSDNGAARRNAAVRKTSAKD